MSSPHAPPKKHLRFLAYGLSVVSHLSLFTVGAFAEPFRVEASLVSARPLFLELKSIPLQAMDAVLPSKPVASTDAPKSRSILKNNISRELAANEQRIKKERLRIDRQIRFIRAKLYRAVKQSRFYGQSSDGFRVVSLEFSGKRWNDYLSNLREKVLEKWYPRLIQMEGQLVSSQARLDFVLTKQGEIKECLVGEWKGSEKFRDLSVQAFQSAAPFGPLPIDEGDKTSGDFVRISLFFYYQ